MQLAERTAGLASASDSRRDALSCDPTPTSLSAGTESSEGAGALGPSPEQAGEAGGEEEARRGHRGHHTGQEAGRYLRVKKPILPMPMGDADTPTCSQGAQSWDLHDILGRGNHGDGMSTQQHWGLEGHWAHFQFLGHAHRKDEQETGSCL